MARRFAPSWPLLLALCILPVAQPAAGQQSQSPAGGVRFLLAAWSPPREVDATAAPVLRRRVSLDLAGATLGEALREITRQADLEIVYSPRVVPVGSPVSLHARDLTVATALTEILAGVPVDVSVTVGGGLALVPRAPRGRSPGAWERADSGSVAGQVTDSASGSPIVGATVTVEGTRRSVVTDAGGQYRIGRVMPGTYTVRARYIGYAPSSRSVTVMAGEEAIANFTLAKSAQQLEQLVVAGTIVPTEVKALPTPVTVISEEDIAVQRPLSVQELFRKAVPGAVGWSYGSAPYQTELSVRGASSITATASSMKIFIDGVDVAAAIYSQIDPTSIERIEVVRGPQAAAIYGSEAIGGVIQVFTKRGDVQLVRPQVSAEAAMGIVQTPYPGHKATLRQEYKASVRGGGPDIGYHLGAGYSHLGDWLPNGEVSRQSNPSVYGGVTYARGSVAVDLSGRYFTTDVAANLLNPELLQSGFAPYSKPSYQPLQYQNQTVGARFSVTPTSWWSSSVNVGLDRYSYDLAQTRPRLTTPADTLLLVANEAATKTSIALHTSLQGTLSSGVSGSLTAGVDHWGRPVSSWYALDAIGTTGTIRTAASGAIGATRTVTHNTGYFTQAQIGLRDVLFLTAGLRAERNSDFGDSLGTPLLPRLGLSYVRPVGNATLKLRGSWGRAIRPISPGQKSGFVSATTIQLPNALLGPERQQGWDAGVDATLGTGGSLSVTYYDQIAENLVDAVVVALTPVYTQQFQNVGSVKNTGVEVEGRISVRMLTLQGQYAYTRSRIEGLSPTYAGDQQIGDTPLLRPRHTAGVSVTVGGPFASSSVSGGLVYVGSRANYDYLALFRCFGGTGACRPTFRDYQIEYPGFVKLNLSLFQRITPIFSGILSIDNLTNNQTDEVSNELPRRGRSVTAGLRVQY